MSQLLLINPRKRKKVMARKKARTPAQKRATRKLVARNRALARARHNPIKVTARSRRTGRTPTKRLKARRSTNKIPGYYPNPRRRRAVNTAKLTVKNAMNQVVKPAAIQASGALLLDVGYGYFGHLIPSAMNNGMLKHATKGLIAVGLGMVAGNFISNKTAKAMAEGAMTVTIHDAMKEAVGSFAPSIPLGDAGYYNPSPVYNDMGYYSNDTGQGFADASLGYFSEDAGQGYNQPFDTSTI